MEMNLTAHEREELRRFGNVVRAVAKQLRDQGLDQKRSDALNELARELGIAGTRERILISDFDRLMNSYRAWLVFGEIPGVPGVHRPKLGKSRSRHRAAKKNPPRRLLGKSKAREMLRRGEFSSARQRRFLGARASGAPVRPAKRNPSRDDWGVYEIARGGRVAGFAAEHSVAGARRFLEREGGVTDVDRFQVRELVRGLTLTKALELARHLQRGGKINAR